MIDFVETRILDSVPGRYERLLEADPDTGGLVEEMHTKSMRVLRPSRMIEGRAFEQMMVSRHDILYVHPAGETNVDKIQGYISYRKVFLPPPRKSIIKIGSVGFRDRRHFGALLEGAHSFLVSNFPPDLYRFVYGIHRSTMGGFGGKLKFLGYRHVNDMHEMRRIFEDMGQEGIKGIFMEDGIVCYDSEKGDIKVVYIFDRDMSYSFRAGR